MKKSFGILLFILSFAFLTPGTDVDAKSSGVNTIGPTTTFDDVFPDDNLANAVASELGKSSGDVVTQAELESITILSAVNVGITDLTGMEYMTGLQELYLYGNEIEDISPLSGLTSLTHLYLHENEISDISPIVDLTSLTNLSLYSNEISDIGTLSGLTNLEFVSLYDNNIEDISALSGLTNLKYLNLDKNEIEDVSPLQDLTNLTGLYLADNNISDVSPLTNLTNLTSLQLQGNQISDASPLAGIPSTCNVNLQGQEIYLLAGNTSEATPFKLENIDGTELPLTFTSGNGSFSNGSLTWETEGTNTATWSVQIAYGQFFSGTVTQEVGASGIIDSDSDGIPDKVDGEPTTPNAKTGDDSSYWPVIALIASGLALVVINKKRRKAN